MGDKKDPGKFTIRFNIADPQQQTVVELLNRQGRYKAQFITSAVLLYAYAASDAQAAPLLNGAVLRNIVAGSHQQSQENMIPAEIKAYNAPDTGWDNGLGDMDLDAIRKTMDAFHPK